MHDVSNRHDMLFVLFLHLPLNPLDRVRKNVEHAPDDGSFSVLELIPLVPILNRFRRNAKKLLGFAWSNPGLV